MASKYSLPHINIESRRERADFKSTNERFPGSPPPRDRQKHGAMLRGQFSQAANDFEQDRPRDERVSPAAGVYLEVELRPNASPDSLERKKSHLKPSGQMIWKRCRKTPTIRSGGRCGASSRQRMLSMLWLKSSMHDALRRNSVWCFQNTWLFPFLPRALPSS